MRSKRFRKMTSIAIACAMTLSVISPFQVFGAESDSVNLQILATSDLHGKFLPYDYATMAESKSGSLAQIATMIKGFKKENGNTVLIDAGDTIQGNSSEIFFNDDVHPMITAMNELGYDTWTLGNHEFNYGMATLEKVMGQTKAAVLSGNVYRPDGTRLAAPYKIVEKGGVKVGVIGMTPPNIINWDSSNLKGYTVTSPIEETKKAVAEIKDKVDIMVAAVHLSENGEYGGDEAAKIAMEVPELAAIIGAHEHKPTNKVINGVVFIENKNAGATLGKIDIKVTKQDGKYVIANRATDIKSDLKYVETKDAAGKVSQVAADSDLSAKLAAFDAKAKADGQTVIGELKEGNLVPDNDVKAIPQSQIQDTAMVDLINEVQTYYGKADISSAAVFNGASNMKVGSIKKADTALIYQYDNTLKVLEVNGKQLKKYMEWSAAYYNTYKQGDLTVSFNQDIRGYNYDMFSGLKYEIDIFKPVDSRIVNLRKMDDTPIKDTDVFRLAVNNYRADSTLLSTLFKGENVKIVADIMEPVRDLIGKYIKEVKGGVITPKVDNNWRIVGNNWSAAKRAEAIQLINSGKITIPVSADGRTPNVASVTEKDVTRATAKKVKIVSFNDFHGTLAEETSATGKNIGAAKLAAAIKSVKDANPDTIIVSAGDIYQGSAMSNLTYGAPVSEMLKSIGLEASAVGNHEFDWGTDKIAGWAKDGGFDFLASNIYDKTTGKPVVWAKPYKVVEKGGLKIGFVGLATPETAFKTSPEIVKNIEFKDPIASAKEWAKYLRETEKVDTVIALTHLGAMQDMKTSVITGEAADLAAAGVVDAVICAHTHQIISGNVNGTPVVQGYYNGRSLAQLTLILDSNNKITEIVPSVDNLYTRKATLVEDPAVKAIVDKYNVKMQPILEQIVGNTAVELPHDRMTGISPLGTWASELMKKAAGTQIAIQNGGGLRAPIAKGDITMGKMYEIMPFDNTIVKMELKGSDIKRVLENGIGNTEVGWVQFAGVNITYDVSLPFGSRITSIKLPNGTAMDMDKYYTVATNDFMYAGGDKYNFAGAKNVVDTGVPVRDAIVSILTGKAVGSLPKTGSMVDTTSMVGLGSIIMLLGCAMFFADRRKKAKKEDVA